MDLASVKLYRPELAKKRDIINKGKSGRIRNWLGLFHGRTFLECVEP